uniref:hypothetical protein n=1 Tax=Vibrio anguillarum TaxID=55601 RepID=UPI001C058D1F
SFVSKIEKHIFENKRVLIRVFSRIYNECRDTILRPTARWWVYKPLLALLVADSFIVVDDDSM